MTEVKNLVKRYGNKVALDDVSFTINEGEILGLLGPNGAGKSTTMNIMTGYICSNQGEVIIDGCEISRDPIRAKSKIGYLPEQPPLYPDMTVKGYLSFMFDLKKVKPSIDESEQSGNYGNNKKLYKQEHIKQICELVGISDVYNRIIKNLSKGYKQRVGLAQALLGSPKLIILDEPTVGLDPKQIIEMRDLIKNLRNKHTVILSSHVLSEIQAVCDRVVVINNGKVVADDKTENLYSTTSVKENRLVCKIEGSPDNVCAILAGIEGVLSVDVIGEIETSIYQYSIVYGPDSDIRRNVSLTMAENSCPVIEMKLEEHSLEDAFLKLTQQEAYISTEKESIVENSEETSENGGENQ